MSVPIVVFLEDEDGNEREVSFPTVWEVCWKCEGNGVHDHEAFSNGISAREFHEDSDFAEDYMAGHYDVQCSECKGLRVVPVVDENRCDPKLLTQYREWQEADAEFAAEQAAERRMGA